MIFKTTLEVSKKTATGIQVPEHIVEALGAGKKPPVKVTIGTYIYRSTVASMAVRIKNDAEVLSFGRSCSYGGELRRIMS